MRGKSTGKMRQLNTRGMTIVLVTDNMWLVQSVRTRDIAAAWRIAAEGRPLWRLTLFKGAEVRYGLRCMRGFFA